MVLIINNLSPKPAPFIALEQVDFR